VLTGAWSTTALMRVSTTIRISDTPPPWLCPTTATLLASAWGSDASDEIRSITVTAICWFTGRAASPGPDPL
jgi:hypothetical protein